MNEGQEVDCFAVVACGDASEVLEFIEAAFDPVSQSVDIAVVVVRLLSQGMWRNDRDCTDGSDGLAQSFGVIGPVAENMAGALAVQQFSGFCDVVRLAWRKRKTQWPSQTIGKHVYFGRQSASGAPQSLILVPPFPVAAC